ncbi:type II toxin-antitoxin system RelE family toxin [Pseudanabaena sp. ABRG5-3]|uniref:type II toxin-antitoxin system RelE family toxin n=1 Tax=Pseudanabaena sp. ABRG5-3 TaxID=685565 RepID=UPI000DC70E27|nr:type II toxin-antitoxin system RelE/ParE family toxin [Pseudanabaena sp. ABRG5-3]BBC24077.1 plasmid stabilization system [Pseudanabaena sp. ABRG5-3]
MSYQVNLPKTVQKQLNTLPQELKQRILKALVQLQEEPRPVNSLQMKGGQGFRLRIGDYRVLYDIDDSSKIVNLRRIGHRREIYRDL